MHAEGILSDATAAGHARIEKRARSIVETASRAYDGMRRLSRRLRPEMLDAVGLSDAIAAILRDLDSAHPTCRLAFERSLLNLAPSPKVAMMAYRVAQEALSNSVKYAQANSVQVTLEAEPAPRHLRMTIVDNGRGFAADQGTSGGLGLLAMRECVAACGGQLMLDSDGTGTRITVVL